MPSISHDVAMHSHILSCPVTRLTIIFLRQIDIYITVKYDHKYCDSNTIRLKYFKLIRHGWRAWQLLLTMAGDFTITPDSKGLAIPQGIDILSTVVTFALDWYSVNICHIYFGLISCRHLSHLLWIDILSTFVTFTLTDRPGILLIPLTDSYKIRSSTSRNSPSLSHMSHLSYEGKYLSHNIWEFYEK